jgi:hypothetical protein
MIVVRPSFRQYLLHQLIFNTENAKDTRSSTEASVSGDWLVSMATSHYLTRFARSAVLSFFVELRVSFVFSVLNMRRQTRPNPIPVGELA